MNSDTRSVRFSPESLSTATARGGRAEQEDSFRVVGVPGQKAILVIVSDGMGGHAGGAAASRMVVDTFAETFVAATGTNRNINECLDAALTNANAHVGAAQDASPARAGMGATITAVHIANGQASWVSVGDSPFWLWRDGRLQRLNDDHSMRALLDGAAPSRLRSVLRSAVNGQPLKLVDRSSTPFRLQRQDVLVVASDGLLTLTEDEIGAVIAANASSGCGSIIEALMTSVRTRNEVNQDNCTVVVTKPRLALAGRGGPTWRSLALRFGFAVVVLSVAAAFFLAR